MNAKQRETAKEIFASVSVVNGTRAGLQAVKDVFPEVEYACARRWAWELRKDGVQIPRDKEEKPRARRERKHRSRSASNNPPQHSHVGIAD